jgi:uncharacterized delta-60 repeat protein
MKFTLATKSTFQLVRVLLLVLVSCVVANAAGNEVDLTFNPVPSNELTSISDGNVALQPDGKIIVFGAFQIVNGTPRRKLARLNTDGTLDSTFNPNASDFGIISSVVAQSNGKMIVAGGAANFGARIVRLNSDGSLDGTFSAPTTPGFQIYSVSVLAVQPDGKVYAASYGSGVHFSYTTLFRLNADGSVDNSFATIGFEGWTAKHYLTDLILLPNGQILISGSHTNGYVFRVNTDGSKDMSFESPLLGNGATWSVAQSMALQSDGKVLFTGSFTTVNAISRTGLTRLNANGTLDLQFPQTIYNSRIRVDSNDKIIVGGTRRLNSDGTLDNTFNAPASLVQTVAWTVDNLNRIVLFGAINDGSVINYQYARLNTDGSFDSSFNPTARLNGSVYIMAIQADNKVVVSGDFSRMNGVLRRNMARLNQDGTLDPTFDTGTGFSATPEAMVVQSDGKILVGGGFSNFNGIPQGRLARLNSDGSLDMTFAPSVDLGVNAIALQPNGGILIGGSFTSVNTVNQKALARLNSNGTLDATFAPLFASATIYAITVQSDNKIMIGGFFSGISGVARTNIARLNSDGGVDTVFNANTISPVRTIVVQPDGKYLASWDSSLRRLNTNGSTDGSFLSPVVSDGGTLIRRLHLQADGSIVMVGAFYQVNSVVRPYLARIKSTGALDLVFFPAGASHEVRDLVVQSDGKLVIGGSFHTVDNILRPGIARISIAPVAAPARPLNFDYDGDGKADVSVYRPSTNYWYLSRSSDFQVTYHYFGAAGDIATPGDFDGDRKTDLAIFRPSTGDWWYQSSITGVFTFAHFGAAGDIPRQSDFDGDGRTDFIIYRPSENNWYRLSSASGEWSQRYFGSAGDKPLIGDFDGDGRSDPAIFRPSTSTFWYMSSIDSVHRAIPFGASTDIPTPADFDGDGKTDAAIYRPSIGYWSVRPSAGGNSYYVAFGTSEDKPVPADYDGDGKDDVAVYRPSNGTWYLLRSTAGFAAQQFGISTDVPTPHTSIP